MASSQSGVTTSYQKDQRLNGESDEEENGVTNEYVLNVAFWTFLGFLLLEAVFAIIANSASMLEDAEAMSVDALTYLFNLCAERIKHRPYSAKERELPESVREYKREMTRLYLELFPPLLSVLTLIVVTAYAIKGALETLGQPDDVPEEDVDVSIMMWFSGANLVLDIVNVSCFARAHQAFGLSTVKREAAPTRYSVRNRGELASTETERLVREEGTEGGEMEGDHSDGGVGQQFLVNLNMCSAWTVSCFSWFLGRVLYFASHRTDVSLKYTAYMCRHTS